MKHLLLTALVLLSGCATKPTESVEVNRADILHIVGEAYQLENYPELGPQIQHYVDLIFLIPPGELEKYVTKQELEHTEHCSKAENSANCLQRVLYRRSENLTGNAIDEAVASLPDSSEESIKTLKQINQPASLAWVSYAYAAGMGVEQNEEQARKWMVAALNGLLDKYSAQSIKSGEAFAPCKGMNLSKALEEQTHYTEAACANVNYLDMSQLLWQVKFIAAEHSGQLHIPCWVIAKHPEAIMTFGPYWGSSRDNFPSVCSTSPLDDLPEHQTFVNRLEKLNGYYSGQSPQCLGSIRYAKYASHKMARLRTGYHPDTIEPPRSNISRYEAANGEGTPLDMESYLIWWASEGAWNYRQYEALKQEAAALKEALIDDGESYGPKWGRNAGEKADRLSAYYFYRYLGSYPSRIESEYLSNPYWLALVKGEAVETKEQASAIDAQLRTHIMNHAILFPRPFKDTTGLIDKFRSEEIPSRTLHAAVIRPSVLAYLLSKGADTEATNGFGKTLLFDAILYRNMDSVRMLVRSGAKVNAKTSANLHICEEISAGARTPLMYAAWHGTPVIMRYLLDNGADATAQDTNGDTAADYLDRNEHLSDAKKDQLRVELRGAIKQGK